MQKIRTPLSVAFGTYAHSNGYHSSTPSGVDMLAAKAATATLLQTATQQALSAIAADAAKLQTVADTWNIATETAPAVEVKNQVQRVTANPNAIAVQVSKSGKEKHAFTESDLHRMSRTVRLQYADEKTLKQLQNGQFGPFLLSVQQALSKGHAESLWQTVSTALNTRMIEGVPYEIPHSSDKRINAQAAKPSKAKALAFAQWLAEPKAFVKGVETPKPLPKGQQYLSDIAVAYLNWLESKAQDSADYTAKCDAIEG